MKTHLDCSGISPESAMTAAMLPVVSVVIPVYNEEPFIHRCLEAVLKQDYPIDKLEIIIADGMSNDRTREIVALFQSRHSNIRLIDNPKRIVPTGLNRAIASAQGEIIVRLDGHCEYPKDYVRRVVELRQQTGADNIGGVLVPVGKNYVQRAVAAAYYSRVGLGGAALKASAGAETIREVDAVHGGCWRRERLLEVGGFDEEMVRNQDDELSFRLRKTNGKIFQCLSLRVVYHVRASFEKLFLQFVQYGFWKVHVIRRHPRQASLRHVAPAGFVLALTTLAMLSLLYPTALLCFLVLAGVYLTTLTVASLMQMRGEIKQIPGVVIALICMHIGYGFGFVLSCPQYVRQRSGTSRLFAESTR
ncbi:MAG: glycosyltransferase family 2 protein [Verrucomicrobia bacterium]|nr:glycosyltransferase family 2 protein [Verrucomicrobiota bacterium]